eukprot:5230197-Pyramimonas_sp.AAC.1
MHIAQHERKQEELGKGGPYKCTALKDDGEVCGERGHARQAALGSYVLHIRPVCNMWFHVLVNRLC